MFSLQNRTLKSIKAQLLFIIIILIQFSNNKALSIITNSSIFNTSNINSTVYNNITQIKHDLYTFQQFQFNQSISIIKNSNNYYIDYTYFNSLGITTSSSSSNNKTNSDSNSTNSNNNTLSTCTDWKSFLNQIPPLIQSYNNKSISNNTNTSSDSNDVYYYKSIQASSMAYSMQSNQYNNNTTVRIMTLFLYHTLIHLSTYLLICSNTYFYIYR